MRELRPDEDTQKRRDTRDRHKCPADREQSPSLRLVAAMRRGELVVLHDGLRSLVEGEGTQGRSWR